MTDSTINTASSEGALEIRASADELFGGIEDDAATVATSEEPEVSAESTPPADTVEDRTADELFSQLQETVPDGGTVDDVLGDDNPDDIVARADEPVPEPDDDLIDDPDALETLLLTGRRKDQEFLWVTVDETGDTVEREDETATDGDDGDAPATPEMDDAEEPEDPDEEDGKSVASDDEDGDGLAAPDDDPSGLLDWLRSKLGGLF